MTLLGGSAAYQIVFDGGSLGNPGKGYGSYRITGPDGSEIVERLDFSRNGEIVTNNQAEYRTLIEALRRLADACGAATGAASLTVNGDSLLVINQLLGKWKVKNADLRPLHCEAKSLVASFARVDLRWHDRSKSVAILGH
ncbi:MAG: ribonuclease HI family protein [Thermomicrobiales bacterium]